MQIHGISSSLSDLVAATKQGDNVETAEATVAVNQGNGATGTATRRIANILSRYDVTDISPNQFSQMLQELSDAGAISQQELQELAAVRADLEDAGVEADESIDLLEFYARKIEKQQRELSDSDEPAGGQRMGPLLNRLDWLEKFALVQAAPDTAGLNAMA